VLALKSRLFALLILALSMSRMSGTDLEGTPIAVVISSNGPAFSEAVGAFRTALGDDNGRVFLVQLSDNVPAKNLTSGARPRIGVAFGSRAFDALAASDPALPLVLTMVLADDSASSSKSQRLVPTVSLSVSAAAILAKLKSTFPRQKSLALLLGPSSRILRSELLVVAQRLGYTLQIVECSGPRDVLDAFAALRGRVDFVWCLPDNNLFPSAAVAPIVLASIRSRLPVIGFSEGFVRAGATVGFYPDYADVGVQTAEMVKRYLSEQEISRIEAPRKIRMAVNDRVLRVLGMERPTLSSEVLVVR
jgi:putative tryptophan/tyrosine transport system substrate-binding protein